MFARDSSGGAQEGSFFFVSILLVIFGRFTTKLSQGLEKLGEV